MKVVLYANSDWYLYNFRRTLIERLLARGDHVVAIAPEGDYAAKIAALGARFRPLRMDRRSVNPLTELALLARLRRILREEGAELVHGFTIKGAVYGGIAARLAGVPYRILAVAGLGYVLSSKSLKARLLRPVVMMVMRLAFAGKNTRLILQNSEDEAFFREAGVMSPAHIRLIPGSGVDCIRFSPRETPRAGPFRLVLPARLLRDKGVELFVRAARLFKSRNEDMVFVLAGSPDPGNPASVTETEVKGWEAEGVVQWNGHVEDMPALLADASVVVLPTKYGEGVPRSLVEAGACGLPVVATEIAGCRELITHDDNGILVPVDDLDALVAAISRLRDHPDLARAMGQAGRLRVLEKFSDEVVLGNTLRIYDEVRDLGARDLDTR